MEMKSNNWNVLYLFMLFRNPKLHEGDLQVANKKQPRRIAAEARPR
jgi:hypothetical protein